MKAKFIKSLSVQSFDDMTIITFNYKGLQYLLNCITIRRIGYDCRFYVDLFVRVYNINRGFGTINFLFNVELAEFFSNDKSFAKQLVNYIIIELENRDVL